MRKRFLTLAISIIIFVMQVNVYSSVGDTDSYYGFDYKIISNTSAAITKYSKNETEVTVPERIGAYTVTQIGNAAFQDQKAVQKIILPESITEISDVNVFWYCTSLKSINLPANLTYLSVGAFSGCSSLEEIVIPDGITTLSKTFRGCTSLKKVVIPDSVTSIDQACFYNSVFNPTGLLSNVTIYCNEGSYAEQFALANGIDCVAEEPPQAVEFSYVKNSDGENTITVTGVKDNVIIKGDYVMSETIDGYTVTKIGPEVFKDQTAMTSFKMPDTVTEISYSVFWACSNLRTVKMSRNITGTLAGTFGYCSNLEYVNIPDNITSMRKTFIGCKSLKNINLSRGLTQIETLTFQSCIGLKTIHLPQSINSIADDAFLYCTTKNIIAFVDSPDSYSAKIADNLNMVCQIVPDYYFQIENREVTVCNNIPSIKIKLHNYNYIGECVVYVAIYESNSALYDVSMRRLSMDCMTYENIEFGFKNEFKDGLTYKIIILDDNLTPLLNAVERELTDKNADVDNYPKMNLFESNSSNSSWDKALTTENFGTAGWTNLAINDEYNYLPYEAYRSFPEIVDRTVTVDFDFSMNKYMDDTRFSVMNEEDVIVGFVTKDTHLYFEQSDGSLIQLAEYVPYVVSDEENKSYVRAELDLANGIVNYIRVDGVIVAENVLLTKKSNSIDAFDVLTGVKATGKLINRQIRINCDYIVNEDFNNQFGKLPDDWTYEINGSKTSVYEINSRVPDRFSIDVDTTDGDFRTAKSFDEVTGNYVFEIMILQPKKRDGLKVSLKNGGKSVIEILADGEDFILKAGKYNDKFYKYQENVWYGLKAELDLVNSKASIFVNNKKVLTDIDLDIRDYIVDNIEIEASKNNSHFIYDDIKLYAKRIMPEDYVPTPVKPKKEETDFVMGMQVCNLWTEGQYNKSWDYIKSAPNRLPVFGPYDEGNPEMNDWEIKWLLEHGIDYELIWAYPNIKYSTNKDQNPIKPNIVREGHYIYDGFMNAEYSDMMKFAISFENDSANYSDKFYNEFFEVYVPYWIEYYFKDSRYLKIDGRPIMGIYVMDKFLSIFGTMGEDDDLINQGIAKFRQMCIDAGVGNPYIISHGFGYTETTFQKYAKYDIDCIGLATWPKHEGLTWQKSDIKNMAKMSDKYDMDFVTTVQPRLDLAAWELRTGFHSSNEEFSNLLTWTRDELPTLITQKSLSKSLLNFLTWNEYGEGHIMMPTQEDGFTYLDCVREVFVTDDEHTDIVPEGEQIKRINRMVDNERLVTTVRENPISRIPDDLSSLSVKKGWYFSSADDYADWKAEASATISQKNGKMIVEALSNEPIVSLNNIPEINLYDVTYVKIRMKGNTTSCGGNIKWTTEFDNTFDDIKRTYLETPVSTASTMTDYYVPVGQNIRCTGRLTGLRITPGLILDKSQKFEIESIELLSDNSISNGVKIVYETKTKPTENEPTYKNSTLMIPLREVVEITGAKVDWYAHNNSYIIYDKANMANACIFEIGASYATKGSSKYELKEKPYCVSDKINDTVYVPYDLIEKALGVKIEWDSIEKTITIKN